MEMLHNPPSGKKAKARAPPPPQTIPKHSVEHMSSTESDGVENQNEEESKEYALHRKVDLTVCLPDGQEKIATVDGSKAVMDFLVDLCSQHHLNPAQYTLEARLGTTQQPFILRPNTLIGTLIVQTVFLKEKVTEVKVRKPAPKVPEKTIRLVVNYLGTQKAVVRVNPAVPLRNIFPVVCEKCEFNQENVKLLRDPVGKEELDMSQSLNELGIKELYAWSKQENNRNLSTSSDTTEKEKKGILGFFRANKRGSKHETSIGHMESDDYEDVFKAAYTSGNRCEGFSTAPSSPSINSRSLAMGSSLSMSNISGIGARTETKKRRAPPPPRPVSQSNAPQKTSEDIPTEPLYASVQKEEQKMKRRAPPPPPPQMPNENNEDIDIGTGSTSNGRQVPQKPPRGVSRSPPQLMIPPPPPYPPPKNDITDPPVFENGAAITGTTKPIPAKRGKKLIRNIRAPAEEVLATDDAGSVNSYTEDSSIIRSPSDSISLDLQTDGYKKSEKFMNQENNNNGTYTAKHLLTQVESSTSEDSCSLNTSSTTVEEEASLVRSGDEDLFITTQFQETLAELDEDSEDMDDGENIKNNHIRAQSSPVGNEQYYCRKSDADVPVTIIDEIPEINTNSLQSNVQLTQPTKEYNVIQHSAAVRDSADSNSESVANITNAAYTNIQPHTLQTVKPSGGSIKKPANDSKVPVSKNEYSSNAPCRLNYFEGRETNLPVSTPSMKIASETTSLNEKPELMSVHNQRVKNWTPQNSVNRITEIPRSLLWRQHTYEPKTGLTTFTVVPPKPDVKKYDGSVSLSASAIKIDDQGNLISPQSSVDIKDTNENTSNDSESPLVQKPLVERAKEFWRSNSMDAQAGDSKDQPIKKVFSKNYKPNQSAENTVTVNVPLPKDSTPVNTLNDRNYELKKTIAGPTAVHHKEMIIIENTAKKAGFPLYRPIFNDIQPKQVNVTITGKTNTGKMDQQPVISQRVSGSQQIQAVSQEKMTIIEKINYEKTELPFSKPSNRTSSKYIASAISKHTEPLSRNTPKNAEVKLYANNDNKNLPWTSTLKNNANIVLQEKNETIQSENKQEANKDSSKNLTYVNGHLNSKLQSDNKSNNFGAASTEAKKYNLVSEPQQFHSTGIGSITEVKKTENNYSCETPTIRPNYNVPANAFLKAVREKSVKIETANSFGSVKKPVAPTTVLEKEGKNNIDSSPAILIDDSDSTIFGPKTKFRPVLQKSAPKDTSVHSALMEAIQSGEGKEKLRKIQSSPTDGDQRKVSEPENERSALLSAIRAHNGISRLKKVSSAASAELESIRNTELSPTGNQSTVNKALSSPPAPVRPLPPPPPPPILSAIPKSLPVFANNTDPREALMEAIRSGQGVSQLRKVSASVRTL